GIEGNRFKSSYGGGFEDLKRQTENMSFGGMTKLLSVIAQMSKNAAGKLVFWNTSTGDVVADWNITNPPWKPGTLAFSSDGRRMATNFLANGISVSDVATKKIIFTADMSKQQSGLALSRDGRRLAVAHYRSTLDIWDIDRRTETIHLHTPRN